MRFGFLARFWYIRYYVPDSREAVPKPWILLPDTTLFRYLVTSCWDILEDKAAKLIMDQESSPAFEGSF